MANVTSPAASAHRVISAPETSGYAYDVTTHWANPAAATMTIANAVIPDQEVYIMYLSIRGMCAVPCAEKHLMQTQQGHVGISPHFTHVVIFPHQQKTLLLQCTRSYIRAGVWPQPKRTRVHDRSGPAQKTVPPTVHNRSQTTG